MISHFEMTNLELMLYFLDIVVSQIYNGIFITQKKYADGILKSFKMDTVKPMLTPVEGKLKLVKDGSDEFVDATNFRRLVGSLGYLTSTSPDITFALGLVTKFMESLRQSR